MMPTICSWLSRLRPRQGIGAPALLVVAVVMRQGPRLRF
jgi:hypothetical protein